VKILIVDDHPLVREGLSSMLTLEPGCEITGQASSVAETLEMLPKTQPDLVLVDLRLKDGCGLDIIERAKERGIKSKFIVLTSSAEKRDFERAQKAGADGYILKDALPEEILYTIRIVGQGRKFFDPSLMQMIMEDFGHNLIDELTPREYEVLMALAKGMRNSQIARKLFITECTVKKHVSQILFKLDLNDRTQAAIYANSKGLVG
jgi:DNA-binding NarL/FixJ family response regulator